MSALDEVQAAGTYTVETEEESLPGLSFPAWRRIATLIFLPSRPGGAFVEQVVNIDRSLFGRGTSTACWASPEPFYLAW